MLPKRARRKVGIVGAEREAEPAALGPGIGRLVGDRPLQVEPGLAGIKRDAELRGVGNDAVRGRLEQGRGRRRAAEKSPRSRAPPSPRDRDAPWPRAVGLALAADLARVLVGAMRHVIVGVSQPLVRVESLVQVLSQGVGRLGVDQFPAGSLVDDRLDAAAGRVERHAEQLVLDAHRGGVGRDISSGRPLGGDEGSVAQRRQVPGHEPQRALVPTGPRRSRGWRRRSRPWSCRVQGTSTAPSRVQGSGLKTTIRRPGTSTALASAAMRSWMAGSTSSAARWA